MSKNLLTPQGDFPAVGLGRRLAAMFYDFLLCTALLIVTGFVYKLIQDGDHRRRTPARDDRRRAAGRRSAVLDGAAVGAVRLLRQVLDPWSGQTLGMQVWGIRVQNANGTAISLWQALLRFMVSIASWLCVGLGFFWSLYDKQKRTGMTSTPTPSWCGSRRRPNNSSTRKPLWERACSRRRCISQYSMLTDTPLSRAGSLPQVL